MKLCEVLKMYDLTTKTNRCKKTDVVVFFNVCKDVPMTKFVVLLPVFCFSTQFMQVLFSITNCRVKLVFLISITNINNAPTILKTNRINRQNQRYR